MLVAVPVCEMLAWPPTTVPFWGADKTVAVGMNTAAIIAEAKSSSRRFVPVLAIRTVPAARNTPDQDHS